jgi:hypothetical protein
MTTEPRPTLCGRCTDERPRGVILVSCDFHAAQRTGNVPPWHSDDNDLDASEDAAPAAYVTCEVCGRDNDTLSPCAPCNVTSAVSAARYPFNNH